MCVAINILYNTINKNNIQKKAVVAHTYFNNVTNNNKNILRGVKQKYVTTNIIAEQNVCNNIFSNKLKIVK